MAVLSRRRRHADPVADGPHDGAADGQLPLRTLLGLWPEPVVLLDRESRFVGLNAAAAGLVGHQLDALEGTAVVELVDSDHRAGVRAGLSALVGGAAGTRIEFRLAEAAPERWVEALGTNLLHLEGLEAIVVQLHDCTERKQAEVRAGRAAVSAREADRRYRVAFETTPVGMATADVDGFYVDANEALCAMLRTPREALVGRHLSHGMDPAQAAAVAATLASLSSGGVGETHLQQVSYERGDGTTVVAESALVPIYDDDGTPLSFMVFTSDVTARHAAVDVLQRALEREHQALESMRDLEVAKGQLLAAISHDFRTPLTAIAGFADLLADGEGRYDDGTRLDFAARISRNAAELDRRITEFVDAARAEHAASTFDPARCDLAAIVDRVVERCRFVLEHHEVRVVAHRSEVVSEEHAVARIVENLLANAAKYSPRGTTITVQVGPTADGDASICVADEGPGIAEEDRDAVFQPFVRLGDAGAPWGAGVGLPGARLLAERLGGRLDVEDNQPAGSRFTLVLPGRPAPAVERPPGGAELSG